MILQSTVWASDISLRPVELYAIIKEVKSHTIVTVGTTFFGVVIIKSAAVIFVDITVLYEDSTHCTSDRLLKLGGYAFRLKLII